ncbi:MAG TPA: hypothetical protein VFR11_00915 [Micromonosporaceae bacterium]|nr:hypothetical protein [Micromonosporaceae bacterium]
MTRRLRRQHILSAVMVTTLAAAATGCAHASHRTAPRASSGPGTSLTANENVNPPNPDAPTVTDGSSRVVIGGAPVTFGSAVHDASWSPDGSRLAYVDADGNIATARPDGTDVRVLTRAGAQVKRAHPTWATGGSSIVFSERGADGVWRLERIGSNLTAANQTEDVQYLDGDESAGDSAPSAASASNSVPNDYSVNRLAYQHAGAHGPEVWILDENQREPVAVKVAAGSDPALAPGGGSVAFIGTSGQLYVEKIADKSAKPVQVTFGATSVGSPAWSPDGKRIAFRTATTIESVSATPAGANANPSRVESTTPGTPTYRPRQATTAVRFAESDPIAAAITLSRTRWLNAPKNGNFTEALDRYAGTVVLVDLDDPAAAPVASQFSGGGGPLLFVRGGVLDARVKAEIRRVLVPGNGFIDAVGAVSDGVVAALTSLGYEVDRVPGQRDPEPDSFVGATTAVVVSSRDQAAIANINVVLSALRTTPLFISSATLSPAQRAAINAIDDLPPGQTSTATPTVYAIGADAAAALHPAWSGRPAMNVVEIVGGDGATESVRLLEAYAYGPTTIALAPTSSWQLQMLAASTGCPVLLVDPTKGLDPSAVTFLVGANGSISTVYAFGDAAMVSDTALANAGTAVSGPGGVTTASPAPLR